MNLLHNSVFFYIMKTITIQFFGIANVYSLKYIVYFIVQNENTSASRVNILTKKY